MPVASIMIPMAKKLQSSSSKQDDLSSSKKLIHASSGVKRQLENAKQMPFRTKKQSGVSTASMQQKVTKMA